MNEILCLVEHRRGEIRPITFELLGAAREVASKLDSEVTAVLLGNNVSEFARQLSEYSNRVLVVDDEKLVNFNQITYQKVLVNLIKERGAILTIIGHTPFGWDLAPSLAVECGLPLATDCIGLDVNDGKLTAVRQMYGGKVNAVVSFSGAIQYVVTVRLGAFNTATSGKKGEIVNLPYAFKEEIEGRKFIGYVEAEAGEVDITQSNIVVAIGRGINKKENLPVVEELTTLLGGVLACSRPVVDLEWLPKDRQVGQSGKTVKPKLYLAIGISGAFQHVLGMRGSEIIVAINKDGNAPIFNIADYGIVDDLFKVVPAINNKIREVKG